MRKIFILALTAIIVLGAATITAMGMPLAQMQEEAKERDRAQADSIRKWNLEHPPKPAAATPPAPVETPATPELAPAAPTSTTPPPAQ